MVFQKIIEFKNLLLIIDHNNSIQLLSIIEMKVETI